MNRHSTGDPDAIIFNEVQLLLAEKRTSLAAIRTGIAVCILPMSVLSLLVATSKFYDAFHVIHLIVPLLGISGILLFLGGYLIIHAVIRIHRHDRTIHQLKQKHGKIAEFIDEG